MGHQYQDSGNSSIHPNKDQDRTSTSLTVRIELERLASLVFSFDRDSSPAQEDSLPQNVEQDDATLVSALLDLKSPRPSMEPNRATSGGLDKGGNPSNNPNSGGQSATGPGPSAPGSSASTRGRARHRSTPDIGGKDVQAGNRSTAGSASQLGTRPGHQRDPSMSSSPTPRSHDPPPFEHPNEDIYASLFGYDHTAPLPSNIQQQPTHLTHRSSHQPPQPQYIPPFHPSPFHQQPTSSTHHSGPSEIPWFYPLDYRALSIEQQQALLVAQQQILSQGSQPPAPMQNQFPVPAPRGRGAAPIPLSPVAFPPTHSPTYQSQELLRQQQQQFLGQFNHDVLHQQNAPYNVPPLQSPIGYSTTPQSINANQNPASSSRARTRSVSTTRPPKPTRSRTVPGPSSSSSPATGGSGAESANGAAGPSDLDEGAINDDKRSRNTAASGTFLSLSPFWFCASTHYHYSYRTARFRIKKKQRALNLERTVTDLQGRAEDLEKEVTELRRENGWLKEMVVMKGRRTLAAMPARGKGKEREDEEMEEEEELPDDVDHDSRPFGGGGTGPGGGGGGAASSSTLERSSNQ